MGRHFEFVLQVAVILRLAQAIDGKRPIEAGRADLVGVEGGGGGEYHRSGFRISLVQLNAPDFSSRLRSCAGLSPRSGCRFRKTNYRSPVAEAVVVERGESGDGDGIRNAGGVDVGGVGGTAIESELEFIRQRR